jgi:hypothetical protein
MALHDPQTLARWRTVFANWRSSGLTVTAFCRSNSLNVSSFYRWRTILEGLDPPAASPSRSPADDQPSTAFVPVRVIPDTVVEVILPSGVQLRVPLGADVQQVARLAHALGAESC